MKKTASIILVLVVLLSLTAQTVLAQGALELIEARNDANGGVIFVIRFTGNFNENDFKGGRVLFGDMNLPMHCNITDAAEGIVQCTTSRAAAGQYVQINLAGHALWAFVPNRGGGGGGVNVLCYNIYDLFEGNEDWEWHAFDSLCSDNPPSELIDYPNPYGGTSYYFFNSQTPCEHTIVEDAYYPYCGE